jgi:manganese-dependent inorganic pyrophosphatase
MKPVLVTSYVNPDLDGVSCMIAYAHLLQAQGTEAEPGIIGEPHVEALYMMNRFTIPHPRRISDAQQYDRIVLVDASDPADLRAAIPLERVVEVIDHRAVYDATAFAHATVQVEQVGAAATLVAERYHRAAAHMPQDIARLLCGGIISNTRNLKAGVTTDRDREALAWLGGTAELPDDFWKELFTAKSDVSGDKLVQRVRGDFKRFELGGKTIGIAELEMMGARSVLESRLAEVTGELVLLKQEQQLDIVLQNTLDLTEEVTFFVAPDADTRQLLERATRAIFRESIAELPYLLMRKQVVPMLKAELERGA